MNNDDLMRDLYAKSKRVGNIHYLVEAEHLQSLRRLSHVIGVVH